MGHGWQSEVPSQTREFTGSMQATSSKLPHFGFERETGEPRHSTVENLSKWNQVFGIPRRHFIVQFSLYGEDHFKRTAGVVAPRCCQARTLRLFFAGSVLSQDGVPGINPSRQTHGIDWGEGNYAGSLCSGNWHVAVLFCGYM